MANPTASRVIVIADGVNPQIGMRVAADGSFSFGTGTAMTQPSSSRVVNVADASDATRLLRFPVVV